MTRSTTARKVLQSLRLTALAGALSAAGLSSAVGVRPNASLQHGPQQRESAPSRPSTAVRPAPPRPVASRPQTSGNTNNPQGHLAQWMEAHRGMPIAEQQRALEAEPGFRQSRPEVQQRMHEQLNQLSNMSPEQRQRTMARTEWMEQLAPERRVQVHSALSNLGALPDDRRRAVSRTFRSLRDLPQAQRNAYLNTPQMRAQFSDQERGVLVDLFAAQPYLPPAPAAVPPGPQAPR